MPNLYAITGHMVHSMGAFPPLLYSLVACTGAEMLRSLNATLVRQHFGDMLPATQRKGTKHHGNGLERSQPSPGTTIGE